MINNETAHSKEDEVRWLERIVVGQKDLAVVDAALKVRSTRPAQRKMPFKYVILDRGMLITTNKGYWRENRDKDRAK